MVHHLSLFLLPRNDSCHVWDALQVLGGLQVARSISQFSPQSEFLRATAEVQSALHHHSGTSPCLSLMRSRYLPPPPSLCQSPLVRRFCTTKSPKEELHTSHRPPFPSSMRSNSASTSLWMALPSTPYTTSSTKWMCGSTIRSPPQVLLPPSKSQFQATNCPPSSPTSLDPHPPPLPMNRVTSIPPSSSTASLFPSLKRVRRSGSCPKWWWILFPSI